MSKGTSSAGAAAGSILNGSTAPTPIKPCEVRSANGGMIEHCRRERCGVTSQASHCYLWRENKSRSLQSAVMTPKRLTGKLFSRGGLPSRVRSSGAAS